VHGIFEQRHLVEALLGSGLLGSGLLGSGPSASFETVRDGFADAVEEHLDLGAVLA
jgi:hypothetical protein